MKFECELSLDGIKMKYMFKTSFCMLRLRLRLHNLVSKFETDTDFCLFSQKLRLRESSVPNIKTYTVTFDFININPISHGGGGGIHPPQD